MWLAVKLFAAVLFYGSAIEPRFVQVVQERGTIPNLPEVWEGKRIAVFADLQVGMWLANRDAARRAVDDAIAARPAVVLIPGDFVYNPINEDNNVDKQMREVLAILAPLLSSGIPTYAVLGNHDYALFNEHSREHEATAQRVRVILDSAGVVMLDNRAVAMASPPRDTAQRPQPALETRSGDTAVVPLWIAGIGERWAKDDSTMRVLAQIPGGAPRVVFMHDPDSYPDIPANMAPLAIAAHTHGLQVGIPFVTDYVYRHYFSDTGSGVAGWIGNYGQPGNHLYVNRGIGLSSAPIRLHCVPEVTVFTLTRGNKD